MNTRVRSKKNVTVEVDVEVREKLIEAAGAVSELATALSWASDDHARRALKRR